MPSRRPSSLVAVELSELLRFHEVIIEAGNDLSPRLILADWLEEHKQPRQAELLRLHAALMATCCDPDHHPEREQQQTRMVELLAAGVRPCLPQQTIALAEDVDMTFAWIAPGTFLMGSPPSELERLSDETRHRVTLTRGFYLGIHPVTQAQWQAVRGDNPSWFYQAENRPVEQVSWDDCQAFCLKLGELADHRYRFRLPTEAEWEYACRAGTTTPFSFGETISTDQVNYDGHYPYGRGNKGIFREQTTPVGGFPANAWGLFGMHGNVWEWCQDWDGRYPKREVKDPKGKRDGLGRVLRGGSWNDYARSCRAARRGSFETGTIPKQKPPIYTAGIKRTTVDSLSYHATWSLRDKPFETRSTAIIFVRAEELGAVKASKGNLIRSERITRGDMEGREYIIEHSKDNVSRERIFAGGKFVYSQSVWGKDEKAVQSPDAEKFFNSFKLSKEDDGKDSKK